MAEVLLGNIKGPKGDKGDGISYDDLSEEEIAEITGPKGDVGDRGPSGLKGDTGTRGPSGTNGTNGTDGKTPEFRLAENGDLFVDFD